MSKITKVVIDVETTGLSWVRDRLHGFSVAWSESDALYFPVTDVPDRVREVLADPTIDKIGHRIRFDLKFLHQMGFEVRGRIWCTKIIAHLLDENAETGLKALALKYLGQESLEGKRELDRAVKSIGGKSVADLCRVDLLSDDWRFVDIIGKYCNEDATNTYRLFNILGQKLRELDTKVKEIFQVKKGPLDYYIEESMPAEEVLLKLELRGINCNAEIIREYGKELEIKRAAVKASMEAIVSKEIESVEEDMFRKALAKRRSDRGQSKVERKSAKYLTLFNWDSGQQVGTLLYEKLGARGTKTKTGKHNTSEQALVYLRSTCDEESRPAKLLDLFAEYRVLGKLTSTYVGNETSGLLSHVHPDGKVYAQYTPFITTGRLASEEPNMQNIPRGSLVKRAFTPSLPNNCFVYMDYSQVELRIAAHLSQDPTMLDLFRLDVDPHRRTGAAVFGKEEKDVTPKERQAGKTLNFLLIYDGGPMRLQEELARSGLHFSLDECKEFRARYFDKYKVYRAYLDKQLEMMKNLGGLVSEAGRLRRVPEIVFGAYIDWRYRKLTAPPELKAKLVGPGEDVRERELFERASKKLSHAKKQGYNFPVQSLGATITKKALIELDRQGYEVRTTVHDSIVVELPRTALHKVPEIKEIMESAYQLSVPLKVDVKILNSLDESDKVDLEKNLPSKLS